MNNGLIKDPTKETESARLIFNIASGTLRDSLQQYTCETEYMSASSEILSMSLVSQVPPDYNTGYEYMNASSVITSMTLTDVLVTYVHPLEDYVSASSAITNMTLTG